MNCDDLQRQLEHAVENREPFPFEDWREHLDQCESCRRLCADHQLLERAVEEWSGVKQAPDLSEQILAILEEDDDVRETAPNKSPRRSGIWFVIASVAAAVLVVIGLQNRDEPDVSTTFVNTSTLDDGSEEPDVDMDEILVDTKKAYDSLLGRAQSTVTSLKPPVTVTTPPTDVVPEEQKSLFPEELKPLQSELTQSFGFLTALIPEPEN